MCSDCMNTEHPAGTCLLDDEGPPPPVGDVDADLLVVGDPRNLGLQRHRVSHVQLRD